MRAKGLSCLDEGGWSLCGKWYWMTFAKLARALSSSSTHSHKNRDNQWLGRKKPRIRNTQATTHEYRPRDIIDAAYPIRQLTKSTQGCPIYHSCSSRNKALSSAQTPPPPLTTSTTYFRKLIQLWDQARLSWLGNEASNTWRKLNPRFCISLSFGHGWGGEVQPPQEWNMIW